MPPPRKEWVSEEERQEHQRALGRARNARWRAKRPKVASVGGTAVGPAEAAPAAVLQSSLVAATNAQQQQQQDQQQRPQRQQCDQAVASLSAANPGHGESTCLVGLRSTTAFTMEARS